MGRKSSYCVFCGSRNVEQISSIQYFCGSCKKTFTNRDLRFCDKILRKKTLLENREMTMDEILVSSLKYIRGFGLNIMPNIEEDLISSIKSGEAEDISIQKLSSLEISAEDVIRPNIGGKNDEL